MVKTMTSHGNCHDNTIVESLLNLLKKERTRRKTY